MMNENEPGDTEPGRANQQIAELGRDLISVLHVEDDPNCREAIADQLSDRGFVVRSFADAISLADGLAVSSETSSFSTGTFQAYRASNCSSSCASAV
jgi:hypothetical protein